MGPIQVLDATFFREFAKRKEELKSDVHVSEQERIQRMNQLLR